MLNKFVVVDLETTGNSPKKGDKIIQFAAVVIENGEITDSFSSLINPNQPIPVFIEELTGINDGMVKQAPHFEEIAPKVVSLLEDAYFVAHNVLFDLSFLQEELIQAGYDGFFGPIVDTVELARILYPTADGYKLTDLAEQQHLQHDRPHQADSDAQVTAELLLILLKRALKLPRKTLRQLAHLSGGLKSDLQQLFDELLLLDKNEVVENLPETIEICNGFAIRKWQTGPTDDLTKKEYIYPSADQEKAKLLKSVLSSYEKRKGQFEMMDGVYDAFHKSMHCLIEAGTGVGKSIGYLLPAAYFSKQTGQKIIISTYTIQLQEQLIQKEVPLLSKLVPFSVKIVLLKGKDHYLSLEKFSQTLLEENDNYDTTLTKMQILVWLLETETGDKDELNLSSGGQIFWNKIKNEQAALGQKGSLKEKDFYARAKSKAEKADLIITNHSLLLSDLKAKNSLLPHFDYVILDEGHHFEKAAARFLGRTLDYLTIRLLLSRLGNFEQKQLFYQLELLVETIRTNQKVMLHTFELNQLINDLFYEMDEFFKLTSLYTQKNSQNRQNMHRLRVRLTRQPLSKEFAALIHSAERFVFLLGDVHSALKERLNVIKKKAVLKAELIVLIEEMQSILSEMADVKDNIKDLIITDSNFVQWVETDIRVPQNVTTITQQPASVAGYLYNDFFQEKKSVVITSATLTVNHSFRFIKKELGLSEVPLNELIIPSPFDYKDQVELLIPEDLPEIKSVSVDDYVVAITEHIITIAEATKGRMLLLFTSHEMLKKTYELIKESGFLNDFAIIAQGITSGSQTRLTRNFQRYEKAILLGTSSFWEGVDIPGEDLTCLVIVRLPFSPPDDPFTEAKCEYVKNNGGNAFSDYSLPEAVLRFKQGFGRLIRTENDKGIIVVFDKRIISTKYGKAFLQSIPAIRVRNGSIDQLVGYIHQWLGTN